MIIPLINIGAPALYHINLAPPDLELASEDLAPGPSLLKIFPAKLLFPKRSGMKINRRILCGPALLISLAGFSLGLPYARANQESIIVTFTNATKSADIDFVNRSSSEKKYIVDSMGGGVAMFAFDNDARRQ